MKEQGARRSRGSSAATALLAVVLTACGGDGGGGAGGAPSQQSAWTTLGTRAQDARPDVSIAGLNAARHARPTWRDYQPPAVYPHTIDTPNIPLEMDDGVVLSLRVVRPADAAGNEAGALPTIVTFTPYNKNVVEYVSLGGGVHGYLVERGYNHVLIDVRGTGRSGGAWDPFSAREQADYPQVLDWVLEQPWSNGVIGLWGISATATTSVLAASRGHPAIKSVFAIVPHGDIYRDVVVVGGQTNVSFLPAWMGVVTALGILNPSFHDQPEQQVTAMLQHLAGLGEFVLPKPVELLLEREQKHDSAYWGAKSTLEVSAGLTAPTFIVGGLWDIFQRSAPMNYEALKNHTTAKFLIGPWHHLQAAQGEGLPMDGVPTLDQLALQWFDHYLKDIDSGAASFPDVTQWVWGHERFDYPGDWPHPQARAQRQYLQAGGALSGEAPHGAAAPSVMLQQPLGGVCSQSSMQISIGILAYLPLPCWTQDNLAQALEITFDTPALEQDLYINGPIQADIWLSTTALDAGVVVRVSDLAPNGTAHALSSGLQTASLRAVDDSRSRYLDGEMIQPWHPLTAESRQEVGSGSIVKVPVEIFQTSALIRKGHRLRISVGPSNVLLATMPLPTLLPSAAGLLSIYHDAEHPSSVVLPVVPAQALYSGR
jgi:uncharacterized protein